MSSRLMGKLARCTMWAHKLGIQVDLWDTIHLQLTRGREGGTCPKTIVLGPRDAPNTPTCLKIHHIGHFALCSGGPPTPHLSEVRLRCWFPALDSLGLDWGWTEMFQGLTLPERQHQMVICWQCAILGVASALACGWRHKITIAIDIIQLYIMGLAAPREIIFHTIILVSCWQSSEVTLLGVTFELSGHTPVVYLLFVCLWQVWFSCQGSSLPSLCCPSLPSLCCWSLEFVFAFLCCPPASLSGNVFLPSGFSFR